MFSTLMSIELKLKVKTEISGYNTGQPIAAPKYTVLPYRVISELYLVSFCRKEILLKNHTQRRTYSILGELHTVHGCNTVLGYVK